MANIDRVGEATPTRSAAWRTTRGRWLTLLGALLLVVSCGRTELNGGNVGTDGGNDPGAPGCMTGQLLCPELESLLCVDPKRDPRHCGACGLACAPGESCSGARCVCTGGGCPTSCDTGLLACATLNGTRCVDPIKDPQNCGACGLTCAPSESCSGGRCTCSGQGCKTACQAPLAACVDDGGLMKCVDLDDSHDHCGSCDVSCFAGETCQQGECLACAETLFHVPVGYETGPLVENASTPPQVADLDGDGKLDVLVASTAGASLSFYRGDGTGALGTRESIDTVQEPAAMALGDLDGDGRLEIIVAGDGVMIHWNESGVSSVAQPLDGGAAWAGSKFVAVAVAELTGDEFPDIVLVGYKDFAGHVWLVRGAARADLAAPELLYDATQDFTRLQLADLNYDGFLDIVAWSVYGDVLWGSGNGTFTAEPGFLGVGLDYPRGFVDMNGDDLLDLWSVASDGFNTYTIKVRLGQPGGGFNLVQDNAPPTLYGAYPQIKIVDYDENGAPDVLIRNDDTSHFWAFPGRRDGTFEPGISSLLPSGIGGYALGDLNEDGRFDVALLHAGVPALTIHRGRTDGTFESYLLGLPEDTLLRDAEVELYPDQTEPLVVTVGGYDDGALRVLRYDGMGSVLEEQQMAVFRPRDVSLTDVDGDGQSDALVSADQGLSWFRYADNGRFGEQQVIDSAYAGDEPIAGDVTGDGQPEVFVRRGTVSGPTDTLRMYSREPSGWTSTEWDIGYPSNAFALGDISADGWPDLVVLVGDQLKVWKAFPGGVPQLAATVTLSRAFWRVQLADLTGDGVDDVMVGDSTGYAAFRGGEGLALELLAASTHPILYDIDYDAGKALDLDGDSFADFIEAEDGGILSLWRGASDGTFQRTERHLVPGAVTPVGVADFTGDGVADMLARGGSRTDGSLSLLKGASKCE